MFPFPPEPPMPSKGPRTSTGMTPEERGKFVLLGIGLLFCLGAIAAFYAYARSGGAVPKEPAGGPEPPPGPIVEFKAEPLFPEEEAPELEKILLERMQEHPGTTHGVPATDAGPFDFLVDQATLNARVLNLLPEAFDRDPDVAKILEDPGARQGKLIAVSGEILRLQRVPWEGKGRQVQEVRRGLLRDAKGRLFTFSWPVGNALEPDAVAPGDGWVKVQGLFYKVWPEEDPAAPGKTVPTLHLVLQRPPVRDYPVLEVRDIDPALMEQVHDGDATDMLTTDPDPFYYLLNFVRTLGPEGIEDWLKARQAASPGLRLHPPEDFAGRYRELLGKPDLYRFRPVRYTGFLLRPTVETVRPNPGNMEKVWAGFIVDADFAPSVWVFSPRSLVGQGFRHEDRVRVDGFFYKRRAYQPRGGGPLKQAAVIIASRIVPAPLPESAFGRGLILAVAGLMAILVGGLVLLIAAGRKEDRIAVERRREMHERRRRAGAAEGGAPAPPAGPGGGSGPSP